MVHLRRGEAVEQREQRTVRFIMRLAMIEKLHKLGARAVHVLGAAQFVKRIGQRAQMSDVEGETARLGGKQHGRLRARRVADAEFVIDVGVENGQIGDGVFGQDQPLVHRLVDETGIHLLVGAHGVETNDLYRLAR